MTRKKPYLSVSDFFNDDNFIAWRLFRSEELNRHWDDFVKGNPETVSLLHEACNRFDAVKLNKSNLTSEEEEKLYTKIVTRINKHNHQTKKKRALYWLSAASCLLILVGSILFFKEADEEVIPQNRDEIVGSSLPSQNVRLILGEEVVNLESNAAITINETGKVSVTDSTQNKKPLQLVDKKTNKLIVPYGKRSFITLSDGTKVWLNSGTELEFASHYDGKSREIQMKGEIYLEVAKSSQPFIVHTERSTIQVLGTEFNISAYEEEPTESIVLVKGRVQVETENNTRITLTPSEMATVTSHTVTKEHVDVSQYISWRDGVIELNKTSMAEVLRKLGRYYNVSFENNGDVQLNEKTVSGKLFLSSSLDSVMTSVSILSSTRYMREDDRIIIRKKNRE